MSDVGLLPDMCMYRNGDMLRVVLVKLLLVLCFLSDFMMIAAAVLTRVVDALPNV